MKRTLFMLSFAIATIPGCGSKKAESYDDILRRMSSFKDAMCKCTDAACAKRAMDDMGAWAVKNSDAIETLKPTSQQQRDEMKKLEDEFKACQATAKG